MTVYIRWSILRIPGCESLAAYIMQDEGCWHVVSYVDLGASKSSSDGGAI